MAGPVASDVELLLEEEERPARSSGGFPQRVALVLAGVGLVAVALLARGGARGLRSKSGEFTVLDANTMDCYETGTYYASPVKMDAAERTSEINAEACQQRCANTDGCAHFSYWPDGGCLLTDKTSTAADAPSKYADTISGPPYCGEMPEAAAAAAKGVTSGIQDAADAVSSGISAAVGSVTSGISAATDTAADTAADVANAVPTVAPLVAAVVPGINGTTCGKYPACVAAGISDGNCCPNDDNVALGCCMGFAPVLAAPKIAAGSECSLFPSCVVLNITGGCCPTPDGTRLGCCDSI